jgi:hypothetical protein
MYKYNKLERVRKEVFMYCFKVLFPHYSGGTEEIHNDPQSGQLGHELNSLQLRDALALSQPALWIIFPLIQLLHL